MILFSRPAFIVLIFWSYFSELSNRIIRIKYLVIGDWSQSMPIRYMSLNDSIRWGHQVPSCGTTGSGTGPRMLTSSPNVFLERVMTDIWTVNIFGRFWFSAILYKGANFCDFPFTPHKASAQSDQNFHWALLVKLRIKCFNLRITKTDQTTCTWMRKLIWSSF